LSEQQAGLEPQRGLVVQELLPPAADDELGNDDRDDVAAPALVELLDVLEQGPGDLSVLRLQHVQRHVDLEALPLRAELGGLVGVVGDGYSVQEVRSKGLR